MSKKHLPARVDRLFRRLQRRTARLDGPHDVLKIANGARQPADPGDHEHVALAQEVEHGVQFLRAGCRGARPLFRADDLPSCSIAV
jgi:hypothetical protein